MKENGSQENVTISLNCNKFMNTVGWRTTDWE